MPGLRYIGKDRSTDWLPGVPARDLTAAEAKEYPQAAESRFYKPESVKAPKETTPEASPAGHGDEKQEN